MALTPTKNIDLGFEIPDFNLPDTVSNQKFSLKDIQGKKGTLVVFICNHCPYVIHLIEPLTVMMNEYKKKGIGMVAISSNDVVNYPADSPELMKAFAFNNGFEFPYLYDESQEVAKAYFAECTPDFNLFDAEGKCVYRGQFDKTRPGNGVATGAELKRALEDVLAGSPISFQQQPSSGCNIKWKK